MTRRFRFWAPGNLEACAGGSCLQAGDAAHFCYQPVRFFLVSEGSAEG